MLHQNSIFATNLRDCSLNYSFSFIIINAIYTQITVVLDKSQEIQVRLTLPHLGF